MKLEPDSARMLADGQTVFEQGDAGDAMYVIESGQIEIYRTKREQHLKLATLGPGEYFGEMALLLDDPRSASARAVGDVKLSVIDRATFKRLSVSEPVIWKLMSEMGQRIQDVDAKLDDFRVRDSRRKEVLSDFIESRQRFY
jgi:CRP-like cAMP-binding protein